MDIGRPVSSSVASISFSFLSTEDVRRLSVKQIVNPVLLDNFNQPNLGGLYDPALGPSTQRDVYVKLCIKLLSQTETVLDAQRAI